MAKGSAWNPRSLRVPVIENASSNVSSEGSDVKLKPEVGSGVELKPAVGSEAEPAVGSGRGNKLRNGLKSWDIAVGGNGHTELEAEVVAFRQLAAKRRNRYRRRRFRNGGAYVVCGCTYLGTCSGTYPGRFHRSEPVAVRTVGICSVAQVTRHGTASAVGRATPEVAVRAVPEVAVWAWRALEEEGGVRAGLGADAGDDVGRGAGDDVGRRAGGGSGGGAGIVAVVRIEGGDRESVVDADANADADADADAAADGAVNDLTPASVVS
eukprot:5284517-Pleurochrysis_carterae.AAC.1